MTATISTIKMGELEAFLSSELYLKGDSIPITDLRVKSQKNNPNAQYDDPVLWVAYDSQNTLLGYIGALPTRLKGVRCAWNTCWWVKAGSKGNLSMQLFYTFLSAWDKNILFSDLTPYTSGIIQKMNFCETTTYWGVRCFLRACFWEYLPKKFPGLRAFDPLLKLTDNMLNSVFNNTYLAKTRYGNPRIEYECAAVPDKDCDVFIARHSGATDRSDSQIFKWISEQSWLRSDTNSHTESDNSKLYHFSYKVKYFKSEWIKMFYEGRLVGLINYCIRDCDMKLPYVFIDKEFEFDAALIIYNIALADPKIKTIAAFHPGMVHQFQNSIKGFLYRRRIPKYTAVSRTLLEATGITYPDYQMGDGDVVFT